jgi:hypothetical protein
MTCAVMLLLMPFTVVSSWDDKPDESRRVYDAQKKFSIIPPPGWDEKPRNDSPSTILSRTGKVVDSFSNFNVKRISMNGDETPLKEIVGFIKEQFKKTHAGFVVLEEKELKIDGKEAYVIFCQHEKTQGTASAKFRAGSYILKADKNTSYVVTFTIMPAVYERLKPKVEESAATIRMVP